MSMYQDNHARTSGNSNSQSRHTRKETGAKSKPKDVGALESRDRKDSEKNVKGAKVSSIYYKYYVAAIICFPRITIRRILWNSILSPALLPPLETVLALAKLRTPEMKPACSLSQLLSP